MTMAAKSALAMGLAISLLASLANAAEKPAVLQKELTEQWPLIDKYCMNCHNNDDYSGELSLEGKLAGDAV